MSDETQPDIKVTETVEIRDPNGDEPVAERTFTSAVKTDGDPWDVATANVGGVANAAYGWIAERENATRKAARNVGHR